jgi:hypothetical protein
VRARAHDRWMKTHPDFEWTFCGERYRIRFFPLTARFEVLAPEGNWVKLIERHRPSERVRFVTVGLPNVLREQLLSALELHRIEERAGFAKTCAKRGERDDRRAA